MKLAHACVHEIGGRAPLIWAHPCATHISTFRRANRLSGWHSTVQLTTVLPQCTTGMHCILVVTHQVIQIDKFFEGQEFLADLLRLLSHAAPVT